MKKLSWIVMGLLFLSGIGMIAWSLFPLPVELVSGQPAGDKPEKTAAERLCLRAEKRIIQARS